MISLAPVTARSCLDEFARRTPQPPFDGLAFQSCKNLTRTDLLKNQNYQCAFCEVPLADNGDSTHLDHLVTQTVAPHRRFDVTNLVACCQNNNTCGHRHDRHCVPDALNPYSAEDLHEAFLCGSDGELYSDTLPAETQKFAFTQLNLNDAGLKTLRATIIAKLREQTIAMGSNTKKRLKKLPTRNVGFISLHVQELGKFGFCVPN